MSFTDFHFSPHIVKAIGSCGFVTPTPIQQQSIEPILQGNDILGLAQTGTGKTAAFALPTIEHLLQAKGDHVKALIIAPTRELAEQINDFTSEIIAGSHLRSLAIYGGVSKNVQVNKLKGRIDIVVACPGRLLDLVNDRAIDLSRISHLILDEADHMFDQGFLPDIRRILKHVPRKRQSLVFSATMPSEIRHLAEEILYRPVKVQIDRIKPATSVGHTLYEVSQSRKNDLLLHLLKENDLTTTLVFTRTKYKAKNLARKLEKAGFKATPLQGNMSQNKRQQSLDGFKDGTYNILVATDIAARGIDVNAISHVINFDVPDTAEAYIHRTGRTGRAALTGEAFTFVTREDAKIIQVIERTLGKTIPRQSVELPPAPQRPQSARPQNGPARSKGRGRNGGGRTGAKSTAKKSGAPKKSTAAKKQRSRGTSASAGIFGLTAGCKQ